MSSTPPGPSGRDSQPPTQQPGTPAVEYLDDKSPATGRNGRRTGLVVGATVAAVAAAGAGAFAVTQFLSGGPSPATAVPSDAFGYVALDLDPDGAQKFEAMKALRKFPVVRDELGVDAGDDLRRALYKAMTADEPCPDLDYDRDIDPWLGAKLGVAAVPGDEEPVPFFVVQVKDQQPAVDAMAAIAECAGEDEPGTAFVGDFMVVAETSGIAEGIAADAEESPLADDGEFDRWIDEAGGSGILEMYVSAEAPQYFAEQDAMPITDELGEVTGSSTLVEPASYEPTAAETPDVEQVLEDFQGGAMVVRFDDEALEIEMAAGGLPSQVDAGGDSGIEDLPSSTALALGFGVTDSAVQDMIDGFASSAGLEESEVEEMLTQAEAETGLALPEDLQKLVGDGLSLAVDSSTDLDALLDGSGDPAQIPAGVRIVGDTDEITEVLDKVLEAAGPVAEGVVVEEGDGVVAVALDSDYAETLAEDGSLGEEDRFQAALDELDGTAGAFYLDFDAGDWLTDLAATDSDERVAENLAPLDSLGLTGSVEDDVLHGVVKLTTD